jgi:hypothetical protein
MWHEGGTAAEEELRFELARRLRLGWWTRVVPATTDLVGKGRNDPRQLTALALRSALRSEWRGL